MNEREKELVDLCLELARLMEAYELSGMKVYNDSIEETMQDIKLTVDQYVRGR